MIKQFAQRTTVISLYVFLEYGTTEVYILSLNLIDVELSIKNEKSYV